MSDRDELETLRARSRLAELEAKASGMNYASMGVPAPAPAPATDPNIDYDQELGDTKFRAAYSFMRGKRQQEVFLNRSLGEGNWGYDQAGTPIVHPAGLAKFGIKSEKSRPIDKPSPSMADMADFASQVPPMLGGIGGSMAATGVGVLPGLALAGGGAALGQAAAEAGKALTGYAPTLGEAAESIGMEGAGGALGEGTFRTIRGVGKLLTQPGKHLMTPERTQLMDEALQRGFMPYPGQVTGSKIQQRVEGVTRKIFGTANEMINIPKTIESLENLRKMAGPTSATKEAIGEQVQADLIGARKAFGEKFSELYNQIDIPVPTASLAKQAQAILDSKTKTIGGEMITLDEPTQKFLTNLTKIPSVQSARQMHDLRSQLANKSLVNSLAPTMDKYEYALLTNAADSTFDDAIKLNASSQYAKAKIDRLREIDSAYREGIRKFDIPFLGNISKKPSQAAAVDADQVLNYAIQEGHTVRAKQFLENLPEKTRALVRRGLADDITSKMFIEGEDPFSKILSGGNFKEALNQYSPETLKAVMGDDWVKEAYKLADIVKMVTSGNNQSGGLVVANAILNPLNHLGALAGYKMLSKAMTNKQFLKLMTTGFASPQSAAGKAALKGIENTLRAMSQASVAIETGTIPEVDRNTNQE
ncbi:MAG: hypothetical protein [Podoviridae sp. ctQNx1]|nr:MAG: hypothetical protein [Podoviridae sp. ctQNx1]UOF78133.1 hypothetical protein [Caudoviricetes sp.]